jgi:hypothetical protein
VLHRFGIGVYLHARIEGLENTAWQTVFTEITCMGAGLLALKVLARQ